jgi:hypothetical protein
VGTRAIGENISFMLFPLFVSQIREGLHLRQAAQGWLVWSEKSSDRLQACPGEENPVKTNYH